MKLIPKSCNALVGKAKLRKRLKMVDKIGCVTKSFIREGFTPKKVKCIGAKTYEEATIC